MRLVDKIIDKGFPDGFAKAFANMMTPHLNRMDDTDRAILEVYIPMILAMSEEAWLSKPHPLIDMVLGDQIDPTRVAQTGCNRE